MAPDPSAPTEAEIQANFNVFIKTFNLDICFSEFAALSAYIAHLLSDDPEFGHDKLLDVPADEFDKVPFFCDFVDDIELSAALRAKFNECRRIAGSNRQILERRIVDAVAFGDHPSAEMTMGVMEGHLSRTFARLTQEKFKALALNGGTLPHGSINEGEETEENGSRNEVKVKEENDEEVDDENEDEAETEDEDEDEDEE